MSLCDESVFSYHQEVQGTHVMRIIYDQEEWLVIFLMRIQNSQNFFKTGLAISHSLQCNYCLVIFFLPQVEYQLIEQLVNYSKVKVSFGRVEFGGLRLEKVTSAYWMLLGGVGFHGISYLPVLLVLTWGLVVVLSRIALLEVLLAYKLY